MTESRYPANFRLPAEFEPQNAVWLSWPCNEASCPRTFPELQKKFGEIAAAISRFEAVHINAEGSWHERIRKTLNAHQADLGRIELHDHPTDDVWCRDHGPIFIKHRDTGEVVVTDWQYNAWGGKFPPWDLDNAIPERVATALGMKRFVSPVIIEGGAIETNGQGLLLTTEAVLLNPNRHNGKPGNKDDLETELKAMLGVEEIVWFRQGIEGDDTDGHIDDLVRFVRDDAVVCMVEPDPADPNHAPLHEIRERLDAVLTTDGRRLDIVELEMPPALEAHGWRLARLPASYANFLILNRAVLVPVFGDSRRDGAALERLAGCFPGRDVIPIEATALVTEGGALHCISMQQPK